MRESPVEADESSVLVSAGFCEVTPRIPMPLGGNGLPMRPWERVADSLEANVLVVHGESGPFVFVSLDALYVGSLVRAEVERGLAGAVSPERLLLSASHSHRAPAVDLGKPLLGAPSLEHLGYVSERIVQLTKTLLRSPPQRATIQAFSSHANHAINRRRRGRPRLSGNGFEWGGVAMAPNRAVECDERVRRFDLISSIGRRIAIFWHYACHPTAAPDRLAVSADFPGVVRARLRERFESVPVLYLQGFSGDVRPPSIATFRDDFVRRVRLGPHFRDFSRPEFADWSSTLAEVVNQSDQRGSEPNVGSYELRSRRMEVPAGAFFSGVESESSVTFHKVSLGPLQIVGVGAELVSAYQGALEDSMGDSSILGVGCIDSVYGYIPTSQQLREGGYEARGFCRLFGVDSVMPGAEATVRACFDRLGGA